MQAEANGHDLPTDLSSTHNRINVQPSTVTASASTDSAEGGSETTSNIGSSIGSSFESDSERDISSTCELGHSTSVDEDVLQFAKYLGMDVDVDRDLLWIAEQAINSPLPAEWQEHEDGDGNQFFYNTVTQESSWEHPSDQRYREIYAKHKSQRSKDRFPAHVTFPVADQDPDALADLDDPVGPRERVKQWVVSQRLASESAYEQSATERQGRQLRMYWGSASDSNFVNRGKLLQQGETAEEEVESGTMQASNPSARTRSILQWRGSQIGSWAPSGTSARNASIQSKAEAASRQFLTKQLEQLQIGSGSNAGGRPPDAVQASCVHNQGGEPRSMTMDTPDGNSVVAETTTSVTSNQAASFGNQAVERSLSEAFGFPGANVVMETGRGSGRGNRKGARGGGISRSRSFKMTRMRSFDASMVLHRR